MGPIARTFAICTLFAIQVSSQQAVTQYLVSNYASHAPIQARPNIPLTIYPNVVATKPTKPATKTPTHPKPDASCGAIDSKVLNNLAIALQLLIISNLMNMPAVDKDPLSISRTVPEAKLNSLIAPKNDASISLQSLVELLSKSSTRPPLTPKPVYYELPKPVLSYDTRLTNANYVGTSQVIDPRFAVARPNPRQGLVLMSPYDALGTSIAEPLAPMAYTKRDFQSPYASILEADGYKDLFSLGDLF